MSNSTRAELRTLTRNELKIDTNWKIWSNTVLDWYINRAYLQIQQDWNLDWQENDANTTYSPTVQETTLPVDFGKLTLVRYDGQELANTTKIDLKRKNIAFLSWKPSKYYLYWWKLWTDTIPSSWTIDLDYKKIIAWFTSDVDTSAYSKNFDTAIVKYSCYLAWAAIRNDNASALKLQEYKIEKQILIWSYIYNDTNQLNFWTQRNYNTWLRSDVLYR